MKRLFVLSFVVIVALVAISLGSEQKSRRRRNRPPAIKSFTPSSVTLQICPYVADNPEVVLFLEATDPDGDSLHYKYSTTEGIISGAGTSVLWNLNGVPRGQHEVHVTVIDGEGGTASAAVTVTTVDSSTCDPGPPPCPIIKVSCPDELNHSKPFIFSARVEGDATTQPSFTWKVNAGRIVKGQTSSQIEVTTTGVFGLDRITATVDVGGFDPSCAGTIVQCTTKIVW